MNQPLRNRVIKYLAAPGAVAVVAASILLGGGDSPDGGLEGRKYYPYYDVAGVLTVCNGHTGPDIIKGKRYSDAECEALLQTDLLKVEKRIIPLIKVDVTTAQKAALLSFAYNVGTGAFARSSLLRHLNAGDRDQACKDLKDWIYAGKDSAGNARKWQGLINRRDIEKEICDWKQQPIKSLVASS